MRGSVAIAAAVLLGAASLAPADANAPVFRDRDWLPEGSRLEPAEIPAERLTILPGIHGLAELGRLAFRSPDILGGNARLSEISCQVCHTNGGANRAFFIPGLSDRPGRVDIAHRLWNPMADDGLDRPVEIPTLHGVGARPVLGSAVRMGSLRDFTRRVVVVEFAGPEPRPDILDALVEYQLALAAEDEQAASVVDRDESAADLPRYLDVLARALAAEDAALAELVSRMIRAALGRLAALPPQEVASPPEGAGPMADWAVRIRDIAREAEAGRFPLARAMLADLRAQVVVRRP